MPRDWKQAAVAFAPDIPQENAAAAAKVLEGLDAAFTPLLEKLPHETEPAYVLLLSRESER